MMNLKLSSSNLSIGGYDNRAQYLFRDSPPLPTFDSNKGYAVIYDGLLYNSKELIGLFGDSLGPEPNSAAIVLQAYLKWGEDLLLKIKGIFSLIIWDSEKNSLLCARDPIGVYPLFYADNGGELLFSTSIDSLIQYPGVSAKLNRQVLAEHLCHLWLNVEETCYEAVRRVPPGHAMRVTGSSRRLYRYWDPFPPGSEVDWIKESEIEQFDELMETVVSRYLDLGQAGIFLSGGLDSVSVAAFAADIAERRRVPAPWALSLVFPDPLCNEETVQRGVAEKLGLPQVLLPFGESVGPDGLVRDSLELTGNWPWPLMNFWLPAYYRLGLEGKERGCRLILTGTGGDEWLSVSPYLAADLLRAGDLRGLYNLWNSANRSYKISAFQFLVNLLWRFGFRPLLASAAKNALHKASPDILRSLRRSRIPKAIPNWIARDTELRREIFRRVEECTTKADKKSYYENEMRSALGHTLISMELEEFFETGKRLGVHFLHPYWDADMVSLLYRIPPHLLNRNGRSKGLVREMLARKFPSLGFGRQKKVIADSFIYSSFMREGPVALKRLGGTPVLAKLDIVDEKEFNLYLTAILSGKEPRKIYRIWDALNMETWLRQRL